MKAKKIKKEIKETLNKAVLIKCKDCLKFSLCDRKEYKMQDEAKEYKVYCILSPNKNKLTYEKAVKRLKNKRK